MNSANQSRTQTIRAGRSATFFILIQNDGSVLDSFPVLGSGSSSGYTVKYYVGTSGGSDITTAVTTGAYQIPTIAPGGSQVIHAVITTARNLIIGATKGFLITFASVADVAKRDSVKATIKISQRDRVGAKHWCIRLLDLTR